MQELLFNSFRWIRLDSVEFEPHHTGRKTNKRSVVYYDLKEVGLTGDLRLKISDTYKSLTLITQLFPLKVASCLENDANLGHRF